MSENPVINPFEDDDDDDEEMEMLDFDDDMDEDMAEDESIAIVQDTLATFLDAASVDAVYGDPIEQGENLIIPSAEVVAVMGFGYGSGYGSGSSPAKEGEEGANVGSGGGSGGGGGGRVLSRPVAIVIASPEGVRVEPVVDVTKIALAALTAFGFMAGFWMRMRSPRLGLKRLREAVKG